MNFIFEQIRTGGDRNFGYLIGDRQAQEGVLVDPSYQPEALCERAEAQGLRISLIFNTHGHSDHSGGNRQAKKLTGARLAAPEGFSRGADLVFRDNEELSVGSLTLRMLHVPGHCPDHILIYLPQEKVAITGDLLFVGKIGGTGSDEDARVEHQSIQRILRELPDETTVWPGHDYGCRPSSTLALEKLCNPFLRAESLDAFLQLKTDWPSFKAQYGLK